MTLRVTARPSGVRVGYTTVHTLAKLESDSLRDVALPKLVDTGIPMVSETRRLNPRPRLRDLLARDRDVRHFIRDETETESPRHRHGSRPRCRDRNHDPAAITVEDVLAAVYADDCL